MAAYIDELIGARLRASPGRSARAAVVAAALALGGCGALSGGDAAEFPRSDRAIAYEVEVRGAPSDAVARAVRAQLALWRRREGGAPSLAMLRRRAEADEAVAARALRAFGHFDAAASATVTADAAGGDATASVELSPGPVFTLRAHRFEIVEAGAAALPALSAAELGSPVGGPARAEEILAAEERALARLRASGRPWAAALGRAATGRRDAAEIDVTTRISAGPAATFGATRIEGAEGVDRAYLESLRPWEPGEPLDPGRLRAYQQALLATDLFSSVAVSAPERPTAGPAPILVALEERPFRSLALGGRYDTDVGPQARLRLEHRNLLGANERLGLTTQLGRLEQRAEIDARKPGFRRPERDLTAGLALRRLEDEAFDEVGATARLGVERRLGPHWRAGLGWLVEITRLEDVGGEDTVELTGAPAFARYDSSDDPLDPTEGARLRLAATPIYARIDQEAAPFLTLDATAARYWALDEARRFVLASRLRAAAIWADEIEDVPLNRRLYSGGGGSVRGFEERFVGPLDAAGDPDGGRSALEAALELRAPVYGDLGAALFVDAGSVSEAIAPDFAEGVQVGAGLGLRYRSPVGPIRVDLATPLNPRPEDDRFEIYFSIGQAF